ncbi:MBL fold metallo-hydrolase [Kaarinaea lacus]
MKTRKRSLLPLGMSIGIATVVLNTANADNQPQRNAAMIFQKVVTAMGGKERILAADTQQIIVSGDRWEPQQTFTPGDEPLSVGSGHYTLTRKFSTGQFHTEWTIDIQYPLVTQRQYTEIISPPYAAVIGVDTLLNIPMAPMLSNRMAARIKHFDLSSPLALIKRTISLQDEVKVKFNKFRKHHRLIVLTVPGREQPVQLFINAKSFLPVKAVTNESDSVEGDSRIEFRYDKWLMVNGVMVPHSIEEKLNDVVISNETREAVYIDIAVNDSLFDIPQELQQPVDEKLFAWGLRSAHWYNRFVPAGIPFDLDQTTPQSITLTEIAQKVFHLRAFTHHSLIVEMNDYLVLFDPVLYEERTQAVLPLIKSTWPDKPIKYVVPTHFHNDHMGGIRGYAAEGANIIVGEDTEEFYEAVLKAPHRLYPDALSKNPRNVKIVEVDDDKETRLTDGKRVIRLLTIPNRHATGMLVPYIEDVKMVFVSDLFNPELFADTLPPLFSFWSKDLLDGLQPLDLDIQWLSGAHGGVTTYERFVEQVLQSQ